MKHNLSIEYKNVRLRPLIEPDLELLRNWRNNPENTVYLSQIPFITSKMQIQWYKRNQIDKDELTFAIEEIDIFNKLVGSLSLYNFSGDKAELGKILIGEKEAHGRKIGLNSLLAILSLCFCVLELSEIYLHVYANNIPAVKVYMQSDFLVREIYETDKGLEYLMSIKKEEYKKK